MKTYTEEQVKDIISEVISDMVSNVENKLGISLDNTKIDNNTEICKPEQSQFDKLVAEHGNKLVRPLMYELSVSPIYEFYETTASNLKITRTALIDKFEDTSKKLREVLKDYIPVAKVVNSVIHADEKFCTIDCLSADTINKFLDCLEKILKILCDSDPYQEYDGLHSRVLNVINPYASAIRGTNNADYIRSSFKFMIYAMNGYYIGNTNISIYDLFVKEITNSSIE